MFGQSSVFLVCIIMPTANYLGPGYFIYFYLRYPDSEKLYTDWINWTLDKSFFAEIFKKNYILNLSENKKKVWKAMNKVWARTELKDIFTETMKFKILRIIVFVKDKRNQNFVAIFLVLNLNDARCDYSWERIFCATLRQVSNVTK